MPSNKPLRSDCMVPFCKNKKQTGNKNTTRQAKPLGPSSKQVKSHSSKFGKLK